MSRNNAPLPAITGDVLKLVVSVSAPERTAEITIPYMGPGFQGAGLAADVNAFPAAWAALFQTLLEDVLPPTATISQYLCQVLSRNDVRSFIQTGVGVGSAGATSLPAQVAAVIQRGTPTKGQHGRGRVMMPYVPNTFTTPATDPEMLNAAGITAYTNFANHVFGAAAFSGVAVNGNTYFPCIAQRPTPPSLVVTLAQFTNFNFTVLDHLLGSVRNRIRRRR